jgi:Ca2+-transporting ATPase
MFVFYFTYLRETHFILDLPMSFNAQYFSMKHLLHNKILVQVPDRARVAVTDLCLDVTGTITQDRMTVMSGLIGLNRKFTIRSDVDDYPPNKSRAYETEDNQAINTSVSLLLQHLINDTITVTSSVTQENDPITGTPVFLGSSTEVALLRFASDLGWPGTLPSKASRILEVIPFSSERKASGAFVDLGQGRRRLHLKGASEILLQKCTQYVNVQADNSKTITAVELNRSERNVINDTLTAYAERGFRTIALCYREFDSWPPVGLGATDDVRHSGNSCFNV